MKYFHAAGFSLITWCCLIGYLGITTEAQAPMSDSDVDSAGALQPVSHSQDKSDSSDFATGSDSTASESAPPGYRYSQFWSFYFYLFDRRHQYGGTAKNLRFDWRSYRDAKFSFLKDAIEESMELGLIDYKKQREPLFLDPDLLRPPRYFPDNWMLGTEKVLHQSHPPDDVPR